jgi:hypothetical protein
MAGNALPKMLTIVAAAANPAALIKSARTECVHVTRVKWSVMASAWTAFPINATAAPAIMFVPTWRTAFSKSAYVKALWNYAATIASIHALKAKFATRGHASAPVREPQCMRQDLLGWDRVRRVFARCAMEP